MGSLTFTPGPTPTLSDQPTGRSCEYRRTGLLAPGGAALTRRVKVEGIFRMGFKHASVPDELGES